MKARIIFTTLPLLLIISSLQQSVIYAANPNIPLIVNLNDPIATSKLHVGTTHMQESLNPAGNTNAINAAKQLLSEGVHYQNQHIIGFGASNLWDDPTKTPNQWNWNSLDRRVQLMRDTNSTPILTLCCAPTWMVDATWTPGKYNGNNTDWNQIEEAPLDQYEDEYGYMVGEIIKRYNGTTLDKNGQPFPRITHFQIWNEMKGLWDLPNNKWNDTKYNRMYGMMYDVIKSNRPEAIIGGPYVRLSKYKNPNNTQRSGISDPKYGTVDQRALDVVTSWLTWLDQNRDNQNNIKAQFLSIDGNIHSVDSTDGTFPPDIWEATQIYADINQWLNNEQQNILNDIPLPIWWSEDYIGKVNGPVVNITQEQYQSSALALMLKHHVISGTATSLRWSPEEQLDTSNNPMGNLQNLFTSTGVANGGQPYDNYFVYKYFHEQFTPGTSIFTPTQTLPNGIHSLSNQTHTLIINTTSIDQTITLGTNQTTNTKDINLAAYQVTITTNPRPQQTTPTTTAKSGDANNDNSINILDYQILSSTLGSETDLRADFNNNGKVNILDYQILANNFGN